MDNKGRINPRFDILGEVSERGFTIELSEKRGMLIVFKEDLLVSVS